MNVGQGRLLPPLGRTAAQRAKGSTLRRGRQPTGRSWSTAGPTRRGRRGPRRVGQARPQPATAAEIFRARLVPHVQHDLLALGDYGGVQHDGHARLAQLGGQHEGAVGEGRDSLLGPAQGVEEEANSLSAGEHCQEAVEDVARVAALDGDLCAQLVAENGLVTVVLIGNGLQEVASLLKHFEFLVVMEALELTNVVV